jgi:hypothetical protein
MLIKFDIPTKLVRLIKMCLNETCIKIRIGKHLSDVFPVQNDLKTRGCFMFITLQPCFRTHH